MTDRVDKAKRSSMMAAIRSKNTKPELAVRKLVHALGFRYRLHCKQLPGKPDLVFGNRKKAIFVHGCFWHRHSGCAMASTPSTRTEFWERKFEANVARDKRVMDALKGSGWDTLIVWQCELRDIEKLTLWLNEFLRR